MGALPFVFLFFVACHAQPQPCTGYETQIECGPSTWVNGLPACDGFRSRTSDVQSVFAIVGDYGYAFNDADTCEEQVLGSGGLLGAFETQYGVLDFVITLGDNNYWAGNCDSISKNVGQFFQGRYLFSTGACRDRSANVPAQSQAGTNKLFPSLGNHDYQPAESTDLANLPYLQYFNYLASLPEAPPEGKGMFYSVSPVPGIRLFSVNSNPGDPAGVKPDPAGWALQVSWLQEALQNATEKFKIVYFHHMPYGTAQHDHTAPWLQLPFAAWGATAVFCGHNHAYERLLLNDPHSDPNSPKIPYVVNGIGGHPWLYSIHNCLKAPGSLVRYDASHGLMLGIYSVDPSGAHTLSFCEYATATASSPPGVLVDSFRLSRPPPTPSPSPSPPAHTVPQVSHPVPADSGQVQGGWLALGVFAGLLVIGLPLAACYSRRIWAYVHTGGLGPLPASLQPQPGLYVAEPSDTSVLIPGTDAGLSDEEDPFQDPFSINHEPTPADPSSTPHRYP